jgi:hypothetical protein
MDARRENEATPMKNRTTVERTSERELVGTRTFNAPARIVFEAKGGKTLLVMHELYPSKEALDAAGTGAADATSETFEQLDALLVTLGASLGRS